MLRCFYHENYFLPLPPGHPFPMEKFPEARAALGDSVHAAEPLSLCRQDLERAHTAAYLDAVNFDTDERPPNHPALSRYDRNRLGLPAHPNLLYRSSLETAGTVSATLAALSHGIAANLAGGTHHAFPDRGLGFCVLNDIAVAIEYLRTRGYELNILILDTDAHQGNANHAYFSDDQLVFTFSIHVGKNYPSRKEAGDFDLPVDRYITDEPYLKILDAALETAFAQIEPDLVFWISGADCHRDDRFGQMALSTEGMATRDTLVLRHCLEYAAPTVVVYGGGYNRTPGMTATLHAQTVRIAAQSASQFASLPR